MAKRKVIIDTRPLPVQPLCPCQHRWDRHDHNPATFKCYECGTAERCG